MRNLWGRGTLYVEGWSSSSTTQELKEETGIDLENIVYYKDDTHYFVMTAKKESLLKKGVLKAVCSIIRPNDST